ncbi:pirin family protein [Mesorhizobium loti]|uniref:Pirin family protein n=2 Tax=Mesorhizobium TaxID=68287 RepID=A0A6M7WZD3_RHILI|nr:pirin family protein [Mesorhizobium loti]QKC86624.1 pirin family protein [Mesorhizobium sp. NZP2077]QKD06213.1 pirin family protein [Mesorhizobium loti R88b]QKD20305.1 pirin family protein [Mesorhizobium sp. NZP2077]
MTVTSALQDSAVEHLILPPVRDLGDGFKVRRALPSAQRRTVGPFIFLDHFGPVVFREGAGLNVRPHPHIGLSTLTYLLEGEMVHRDSIGSVETVRPGDVNWMTAGSGIVHSERSPAKLQAQGGTMFGQQIWVALPKALEEMQPGFSNHANGTLPRLQADGASLTVVAGSAFGERSPVPVYSDLMYVDAVLQPGARLQVPTDHIERAVFVVSGEIEVAGQTGTFGEAQFVVFKPGAEIIVSTRGGAHLMLVGGEPFPEQRHVYWNFVSSSKDRIEQAKDDWRQGRFPEVAGETEFIPLPPEPTQVESAGS